MLMLWISWFHNTLSIHFFLSCCVSSRVGVGKAKSIFFLVLDEMWKNYYLYLCSGDSPFIFAVVVIVIGA
ncbi:hypothetical protein AB205_0026880 [Aquarana catesbeiana]|uniref:Uncharacterized protein n=1 Tax=Aquarana catesbeiana TaxID=8400 RepID=A0A2G9RJ05_AQUCT|nr:hypothetical protein AB205_0026880 [Aquarana catesbeiana]